MKLNSSNQVCKYVVSVEGIIHCTVSTNYMYFFKNIA
jgi:hypothetical protein